MGAHARARERVRERGRGGREGDTDMRTPMPIGAMWEWPRVDGQTGGTSRR